MKQGHKGMLRAVNLVRIKVENFTHERAGHIRRGLTTIPTLRVNKIL